MNYRFTHSARKGKFAAEFWMPVCFLIVLIVFYIAYPALFQKAVASVAAPLLKAKLSVVNGAEELFLFFASKRQLTLEVQELSAKLSRAQALLVDRELLLSENRILKEQFGRNTRGGKERRIGAILGASPRSPYDTAVIDVGFEDGARIGDLAFFGSVVLGTISKVFPHTSLVTFFSTAGVKTDVVILREDVAIPVEAEGRGGGEFKVVLPKGVPVAVGDHVTMPGFNSSVFAVVATVEAHEADSFQIVRFRNPVSLESLRLLEIQRPDGAAFGEESSKEETILSQ